MTQFLQQHWVTILTCVALIGICVIAVLKMAKVVEEDARANPGANDTDAPRADPDEKAASKPLPKDVFGHFPLSEEKVRYKCGHDGWKDFEANFYGMRVSPTKEHLKKRLECPDCMTEAIRPSVIRCCACGHAILPGEGVVAYRVDDTTPKEWVTKLPDGRAIGCLRMACCDIAALYIGKWTGKEVAFKYEGGRTAAEEAFATGKPVINNDM